MTGAGASSSPQKRVPLAYWIVATSVLVVGIVASMGIGLPILVLGVALLLLAPLYPRPKLFWPLAAVVTVPAAIWFARWAWWAS